MRPKWLSSPTTAHPRRSASAGRALNLALLAALCAIPRAAPAQAPSPTASDPKALFDALNRITIDPSQIYVMRDVRLRKDRATFYFDRGFLALLTKVNGEVTGAGFVGDGEVLLVPPDPTERQSLALFANAPVLEERFSSAYFRFTDDSAAELAAKGHPPDAGSPAPTGLVEIWNSRTALANASQSARILEDLVSIHRPEYFMAAIQGLVLGALEISIDERRPEAVQVAALGSAGGAPIVDTWCSFPTSDQKRSGTAQPPPYEVHSFHVETRVDPATGIEGVADLELEERSPERFLAFNLSSRLDVTEVRDEQNTVLPTFRGDLGRHASARNDWVAVVLPQAHPVGERFRLKFTYHGQVIVGVGNGVLNVGEHESWYPNGGPSPQASYDLTFISPANLTLVATGHLAENTEAEGDRRTRWLSDGIFPLAGFNLGPYNARERSLAHVQIDVLATRGAETALERRYQEAAAAEARTPEGGVARLAPPRIVMPLSPSALIDKIADEAAEAVGYFETLFGPFPYPHLTISQVPGRSGQGWPELVYLPTASFLPGSVTSELAGRNAAEDLENRTALAHEIAHQWWGNEVGWRSYHDQWLAEGFASYAAALNLAQGKGGDRLVHNLLGDYRRDLLAKDKDGDTIESGGPIWLGSRLSNSLNPDGYDAIVYKKACWVIQMLRMLMTDPDTGSDARFFQMLRDFLAANRGGSPSTEDFIALAAKYTTPAADLEHDGRLDWFFKEWVYSTGIPEYKLQFTAHPLPGGTYRVEGSISSTGGPPDFEMLVPVLVQEVSPSGGRKTGRILVPVLGAAGRFHVTTRGRPEHVSIDEDRILTADR